MSYKTQIAMIVGRHSEASKTEEMTVRLGGAFTSLGRIVKFSRQDRSKVPTKLVIQDSDDRDRVTSTFRTIGAEIGFVAKPETGEVVTLNVTIPRGEGVDPEVYSINLAAE